MLLWWLALAFAGKWDDAESDIEVKRVLTGTPVELHAAVADLQRFSALLPQDCATDWEFTSATAGRGARAKVTYTMGPLKRKALAAVVDDQPGRIWRLEHEGEKKGFFTQFVFAEAQGGTEVTLVSYLNAPPWPVKGPFYKKVRPAWQGCYERTLDALQAAVAP